MGFQLNATPAAQVEISGDITSTSTPSTDLATGQTRKVFGGLYILTSGTIADLYTVTASKKLYITGIIIVSSSAMLVKIGDKATLTNNTSTNFQEANVCVTRVNATQSNTTITFPVPLEVDDTLSAVANASAGLEYTIIGFEA